jgi:hypothetical protein
VHECALIQRPLFGNTGLGACWLPGWQCICQAWIAGGHPERSVDITQGQLA